MGQQNNEGILDAADKQILESARTGEGLIKLSKVLLMELAMALSETFNYYHEQARKCMTQEQAEFVRELRVDKGYSWRAIAHACYDQTWQDWEMWIPSYSQPMGRALCERAAQFFGEDYRSEPWNFSFYLNKKGDEGKWK